jgi:hypothetical protein
MTAAGDPRTADGAVVTGLGVHGPLGDAAASWRAWAEGRSAVGMHQLAGVHGFGAVAAARASAASVEPWLRDRKLVKYMSPAARMAVVAAGGALRQAGLLEDEPRRAELGLMMATGLIAFDLGHVDRAIRGARDGDGQLDLVRLGREGLRACHPLLPFQLLGNMPLGLVSIAYGIRGENFVLYPDAGQAGSCLEAAVRAIRVGRLERVLVGGTAELVSLLPLGTLGRRGQLAASPEAAQPFAPCHAGVAPADAAAFLVLERESAARGRGASILGRLDAAMPVSLLEPDQATSGREPRREVWAAICGDVAPLRLIVTGTRSAAEDRGVLDDARALWGLAPSAIVSLDGILGYPGPAAPFLALGLGCSAPAGRTLVWSAPFAEHGWALLLAAHGGPP